HLYDHFSSVLVIIPYTEEIYTLSLHDALPICYDQRKQKRLHERFWDPNRVLRPIVSLRHLPADEYGPSNYLQFSRQHRLLGRRTDRKSTRLNSSHVSISYAVFCLKKKKNTSQK